MTRGGGDTPFVGRVDELRALHTIVDGAAAGRGSVVLVLGEAGSGKSRLITEVVERSAADGEPRCGRSARRCARVRDRAALRRDPRGAARLADLVRRRPVGAERDREPSSKPGRDRRPSSRSPTTCSRCSRRSAAQPPPSSSSRTFIGPMAEPFGSYASSSTASRHRRSASSSRAGRRHLAPSCTGSSLRPLRTSCRAPSFRPLDRRVAAAREPAGRWRARPSLRRSDQGREGQSSDGARARRGARPAARLRPSPRSSSLPPRRCARVACSPRRVADSTWTRSRSCRRPRCWGRR